jgi:CheY-like chemotaxis protein
MDGVNFVRKTRSLCPGFSIPVIVISSTTDSAVEKELYDAGVKAVIKKPISPDKVVKAMGGLL